MKKITLVVSLSFLSSFLVKSQTYFQQEVNYTIDVRLDDKNHFLHAQESFEYVNNSPDTLREIFIHLWPNAYKGPKSALAKQLARDGNFYLYYAENRYKGNIDSLSFKVNGKDVAFEFYKQYEDIARIVLPDPLLPGKQVVVSTPFRIKIPSGTISRLGHIEQSYQVTQWYPKPAVYDNDGWHPIPYLTQGEFYSEFGSFDVRITLPENYTVGATGDLQTESELERLDALSKLPVTGSENDFPPSAEQWKTLHYKQKHVHDFGWFADKRWIVRKGEVVLPNTGRKVTTWAMFTPRNAGQWDGNKAIGYINDALYNYSYWVGDYPYDQCTAVDGTISAGGGMEYPNVTVIGNSSSDFQLATVIIHEVGHNWFYGILGSNEREHGWMDEGINSFFETLTLEWVYKDPKIYEGILTDQIGKSLHLDRYPLNFQNELFYLMMARAGKDQPIQTSSEDFTGTNYGAIMYKKTGLAFNYLKNYLGDEVFRSCMHAYFDAWKFKHPGPADIRRIFETTSGKDLGWFFDRVILTDDAVDYKAESARMKNDTLRLSVFNAGGIAAPFSISVFRDGSEVKKVWMDGFETGSWNDYSIPEVKKGDVIKLNVDKGTIDIDRGNNNIRTQGILRTREPLKLSLLTGLDNPEWTRLFWMPLVAWNDHDKWMGGITIHNRTIPTRKFEFALTPLFSITDGRLNGFGMMAINGRRFTAGVSAKAFSLNNVVFQHTDLSDEIYANTYQQVNPYFEWRSRTTTSVNPWKGGVRVDGFAVRNRRIAEEVKYTRLENEYLTYGASLTANLSKRFIGGSVIIIPQVDYAVQENTSGAVAKLRAEAEYTYYRKKGKKIYLRTFAATNDFGSGMNYVLPLAVGGTDGVSDYFYRHLFLGRATDEGLLSNQIVDNQGGFYMPVKGARSGFTSYAGTVQFEADLPIELPLSVFAAMATDMEGKTAYNAGIGFPVVRNVMQLYLPLVFSSAEQKIIDDAGIKWYDQMLFQLNIDLMSPFELMKQIR